MNQVNKFLGFRWAIGGWVPTFVPMSLTTTPDDLVEIYRTGDPLEADVIRDEVLAPNQIACFIRDRTSHPFNTPTMAGGLYLAVARPDAERARKLIETAREDKVVSSVGSLL